MALKLSADAGHYNITLFSLGVTYKQCTLNPSLVCTIIGLIKYMYTHDQRGLLHIPPIKKQKTKNLTPSIKTPILILMEAKLASCTCIYHTFSVCI